MDLDSLSVRIGLPELALEAGRRYALDERDYQECWQKIHADLPAFAKDFEQRDEACQKALAFYLRAAAQAYEDYLARGIPDDIFDATMSDITIWCQDYFDRTGRYGIDQFFWIGVSVTLRLFRLGRLQFEPIEIDQDFECAGRRIVKGSAALNVHIAAGEPLDIEACERSFEMAREFFGIDKPVFICDSWLLAPALKEMLPPNSNIVRFQDMFQIAAVHHRFRQAEGRVFGELREDPSSYPQETSLQRSLRSFLMEGKEPGIGIGFIF